MMSEPIASKTRPKASKKPESVVAITRRVVTSRKFAIRVLIGVLGAVALGWLGPRAALLGLILSQLLGDVVEEVVVNREWSLRRIWLIVVFLVLFDFGRRAWAAIRKRPAERQTRAPLTGPVVSTLAATALVVGGFTVADAARGQSPLNDRRTTFFGGRVLQSAPPTLKLPDGHVVEADTSGTRLAFGDVRVGRSSPAKSILLSSGSKELEELAVAAAPAEFRLESSCARTLPARSSCDMTLVFRPERAGHFRGRLTVAFRRDPELALELTGIAIAEVAPSIVPSELRFPGTRVATTTTARTVTLRAGSAELPIAGISIGSRDFRISHDDCPRRLAATRSCAIDVTFGPTAAGNRGTVLTVARGNGGPALTVRHVGAGVAPTTKPTLRPGQVDFGSVRLRSSSNPIVFTLTAGSDALPLAAISTGSKDFTINAESCPGRLESSRSCAISVIFNPVVPGSRKATLTVSRSDGGPALTADLRGSGLAVPATLTPTRANFGSITVGSKSKPIAFTLTAGSDTLPIANVTILSKDYQVANACPLRLAAWTSCTISVTFTPVATGSRNATLTVNRGDGGPAITATLTGAGLAPFVVLTPTSIDFGNLCTDCPFESSTKRVTLSNTGTAPLTIKAILSSDSKQFSVTNKCPPTLPAGRRCAFYVTFKPADAGEYKAVVRIDADGFGQRSLSVRGSGSVG
jgi:hypothetical protein